MTNNQELTRTIEYYPGFLRVVLEYRAGSNVLLSRLPRDWTVESRKLKMENVFAFGELHFIHFPISTVHCPTPFDLHVLNAPLAFILSQDQTLRKEKFVSANAEIKVGITSDKKFNLLSPSKWKYFLFPATF